MQGPQILWQKKRKMLLFADDSMFTDLMMISGNIIYKICYYVGILYNAGICIPNLVLRLKGSNATKWAVSKKIKFLFCKAFLGSFSISLALAIYRSLKIFLSSILNIIICAFDHNIKPLSIFDHQIFIWNIVVIEVYDLVIFYINKYLR